MNYRTAQRVTTMAESFEVGEIAIGHHPEHVDCKGCAHGREVLIVGPLRPTLMGFDLQVHSAYRVKLDGEERNALPEWLRKKPRIQDREQVGEWDECPWQPSPTTVSREQPI